MTFCTPVRRSTTELQETRGSLVQMRQTSRILLGLDLSMCDNVWKELIVYFKLGEMMTKILISQ